MAANRDSKVAEAVNGKEFRFFWFSELRKKAVLTAAKKKPLGKLSDLVFRLAEPYPEAVGICVEHGWGKPAEFVPWNKIVRIGKDVIIVEPSEDGTAYGPFVDQPGWMLLDQHLMGKTMLDTDGRRIEKVNDVHLLESKGRLIVVHVDISFNGILRKWGLGNLRWIRDNLISWRYVQPFSLEDAVRADTVSLSITKEQARELPGEDLADVLELLSGEEQEAFFSALDAEKAAEALVHAEPRAKRQLIGDLPKERAQTILAELSIPQLSDLFSVLPHDDVTELMQMLPKEKARSIRRIRKLHGQEVRAGDLMSSDLLTFAQGATIGEALRAIRKSALDPEMISYAYIANEEKKLIGVVDIRELILAPDDVRLGEIMSPSVVSAEEDQTREDLEEILAKYHYRMIPVVDASDHLLGVVRYNDLMQSLSDQKT
jgi:CBS domain-containing protein/sporulation protein YlmC with PRC-barrel domain